MNNHDTPQKPKANYASMLKYGIIPTGMMASLPAFAAIDTTAVVNEIKGASTAIDAVGAAIIGVVVGILVIMFIVGMLRRNG